ncbi:CIA30 family protein [Tenacibaculum aiptasiae]|uniref:CIA30 family protein n=1 Tax=Tenacibaculum aiptasiae TaxID=426481 RepID=A0A7J5AJS9_9FLAO|nr:CIA30 family protein [Tenacibaculum aiptasiae]KAB1157259.1 CIA30 family protein [Tenacibaculum aiptasiae]
MKWLILISVFFFVSDEIVVFDKAQNSQKWYITNDVVMGGLSKSSMEVNKEGKAVFSGEVSTENNGGFAMTRLPLAINLDGEKSKIVLNLKGDGKEYQLRLKASRSQRFWYVHKFQTTTENQEIELPLADFYPSFRGYTLDLANFSGDQLKEMAILIGNKKNESFNLEIEKITIR